MAKKNYDVLVIGPVSLDHNIDYQGNERREVGGAVVASGFAAAKSGNRTAVFTKLNPADADVEARNLSGRTGRGDTTFAGYITERQRADIREALLYCTALVSLKMETPGPFQGTRQDMLDYIREFYRH